MSSLRILSVAFVASFLCTAPLAYAYVTPDEFIEGNGGGTTGDGGGEIGDVPLPTLTPSPQSSSSVPSSSPSSPSSSPSPSSPSPSLSRKENEGEALVPKLLPKEKKKQEVPVPSWDAREEERKVLRGVHDAAPEIPHAAAIPLASSGLPFAFPLLISVLTAGSTELIRRKWRK